MCENLCSEIHGDLSSKIKASAVQTQQTLLNFRIPPKYLQNVFGKYHDHTQSQQDYSHRSVKSFW